MNNNYASKPSRQVVNEKGTSYKTKIRTKPIVVVALKMMADYFAPPPPPTLSQMFITSIDTLNGGEIDLRVTPGWNDRPPLLVEKGTWRKRERPEDPQLLKGVRFIMNVPSVRFSF